MNRNKALTSVRVLDFQGLRGLDGTFMAKLGMEASNDATRENKKQKILQVRNRETVPRSLFEI